MLNTLAAAQETPGSALVPSAGGGVPPPRTFAPEERRKNPMKKTGKEFVSAGRRNQHARRVRSPEFAASRVLAYAPSFSFHSFLSRRLCAFAKNCAPSPSPSSTRKMPRASSSPSPPPRKTPVSPQTHDPGAGAGPLPGADPSAARSRSGKKSASCPAGNRRLAFPGDRGYCRWMLHNRPASQRTHRMAGVE